MDGSTLFGNGAYANGQPHNLGTPGMMPGQPMMGHAMGGPIGMCGPAHLQAGQLPHSSSAPLMFRAPSNNSIYGMDPGLNATPAPVFPLKSPTIANAALLEIPDLTNLSDNNNSGGGPLGLKLRKSNSFANLISGEIQRNHSG
jgi:hypothetical protein